MLQEDTGQTSAELLFRISNQLTSLTLTPPYVNSTLDRDPLSSQPFQATASARWINSLWFLSLTLSLASALLGILVKQWIREYLQWNSPTATSRENVLVRQIRIEAWDEWRTTLIISSIPALLELAIVLFVCGMSIFLWTLDLVVAIVVTICAALFLSLVATLTLLPTIFKRCPYKSPTAWAFVLLFGLLTRSWNLFLRHFPHKSHPPLEEPSEATALNDHFSSIHSLSYSDRKSTWRVRDLQDAQLTTLRNRRGQVSDAHSVLLEELELEVSGALALRIARPSTKDGASSSDIGPAVISTYCGAVSEADLLFKALVWITAELPDRSALQYLLRCARSIHPSLDCIQHDSVLSSSVQLTEMAVDGGFRNLSIWYMLSRIDVTGPGYMGSFVNHPNITRAPRPGESSIAAYMLAIVRDTILGRSRPRILPYTFVPPTDGDFDKAIEYAGDHLCNSKYIVMSYILACSFKARVAELVHPRILSLPPGHGVVQLLHRRMEEVLCALRFVAFCWDSAAPLVRSSQYESAQILADTFNTLMEHPRKQDFDSRFPSLRYQIFWLLSTARYQIRFASSNALIINAPEPSGMFSSNLCTDMKANYRLSVTSAGVPQSGTNWQSAAVTYSLDAPCTLQDDYSIFAQIMSFALAEASQLSPGEIAVLCGKGTSALRHATTREWRDTLALLCEVWTQQLKQAAEHDDCNRPICAIMFDRAPALFLRLLLTLQAHLPGVSGVSSQNMADILLVLLSIPVPTGSLRPTSTWSEALDKSSTLVIHYPLDLPTHAREWQHLFVWAADDWIARVVTAHANSFLDICEDSQAVADVLQKMADGMALAIRRGWQNGGYDGGVFPWPATMLSFASSHGTHRAAETTIPITVLRHHAPSAFEHLLQVLERGVEAGIFFSRMVDFDIRLMRSLATVEPQEARDVFDWRAAVALQTAQNSGDQMCSYYLP